MHRALISRIGSASPAVAVVGTVPQCQCGGTFPVDVLDHREGSQWGNEICRNGDKQSSERTSGSVTG